MVLDGVRGVIAAGAVRTVFQPIVDLDAGTVVAYEALSRGPEGKWERPDVLFAAAAQEGVLGALDALCRTSALRTATQLAWPEGVALFVNVEPQVLDAEPLDDLIELARAAPYDLQVVLEVTERAISARPAELLACVRRLRHAGWRIALDDVGADDMSLAFMPLLKPDMVKLDLKLVQRRPGPDIARIMNAVNAYAQRTGAILLAEGIEDEQHLATARALGARLGQGWLFGRPASTLHDSLPVGAAGWAASTEVVTPDSPFSCLPPDTVLRTSTKPLLVEISKHLEQEALERGATCVVVSTFQFAHHFTPQTQSRYTKLAERLGFVAAIGEGLPIEPAPGVRGADLAPGDVLRDEWDIVVLAPHFAAALLARDLGDTGPERDRRFEFSLTYDRAVVSAAAEALLTRVAPLQFPSATPHGTSDQPSSDARTQSVSRSSSTNRFDAAADFVASSRSADSVTMLRRALGATTNGVTIADVTRPKHPLVFVNAAFERLSGMSAAQVLGSNCRFMQGPATDENAVSRLRTAIAEGRECRETLLNYRPGESEPWWNEIYLAPIRDGRGNVIQYIGIQNDVTTRVTAERELAEERARSRAYLAEMETLAYSDPLTGLLNRRRLPELLADCLDHAGSDQRGVGFLYLDVDRFKAVNDTLGHKVGDTLLCRIGEHLLNGPGKLKARIGGDEFLVVLDDLDPRSARADVDRAATELQTLLDNDTAVPQVGVSIGVSIFPDDGISFDDLLHAADQRMYESKAHSRARSDGYSTRVAKMPEQGTLTSA